MQEVTLFNFAPSFHSLLLTSPHPFTRLHLSSQEIPSQDALYDLLTMLRLSLLAAALAAIAQADQKTYTSEVCITKHRPAQYAPTSIPTSTRTSSQTVCYTTTTCGTATTTTTITPEPVSFTKGMSGNVLKVRAAITVFAAAKEVTCSTTTTMYAQHEFLLRLPC